MSDALMVESAYLNKARESLAGAESEFANTRYDNCANRCYYACFQAGVHALEWANVRPRASSARITWSHEALQSLFVRELINRRKLLPSKYRDTLSRASGLRITADYRPDFVSERQALRVLRQAREFVQSISDLTGGES